ARNLLPLCDEMSDEPYVCSGSSPPKTGCSRSMNHHLGGILILEPVFHRETEQRQAVARGRGCSAKNPAHVLVKVGKTELHQQRLSQHLTNMETGEQAAIVEVIY